MAKSDKPGRRGGSKKKQDTASVPPSAPDDLVPDDLVDIESPPSDGSTDTEPSEPPLVPVRSVVQQLLANLTPANAAATARVARDLEERFGELRRRAQQIEDGLQARREIEASQDQAYLEAPVVDPGLEMVALEEFRAEAFTILDLNGSAAERAVKAAATPGGGTDGQVKLDQFFADVSTSVIQAQRQLDQASMQYMLERDHTVIPPAVFSIPKVEAEVKIGFRSSKTSGVDILLIKNTQQAEQFGESTVRFNIVAAPPPPNAKRDFAQPIPEILAVGAERDKVLQTVADGLSSMPGIPAGFRLKADWKDRAAVVRLVKDPANSHSVIAPAAEDKTPSRLLVALLKPGASAGQLQLAAAALDDGQRAAATSAVADAVNRWLESVRVH